jgi:hypothetical protein
MPRNQEFDDSEADPTPKPTLWMRFQTAIVKPDDLDSPKSKSSEPVESVEELEATIARANDKERNIGLVAAPVGGVIALVISANLIHHAQQTGQSTSVYQTLTFVLMGMAVLLLVTSWLRKRLFIGIVMALFGLGIFNLKYWGFGLPFIMGGAWYLVRAWRLQAKLKLATAAGKTSVGSPNRLPSAGGVLPRPNKRYTPPTEKRKRPSKANPGA